MGGGKEKSVPTRCQRTDPRCPFDPKDGERASIEESVLPARSGVRAQLGRSPEVPNGLECEPRLPIDRRGFLLSAMVHPTDPQNPNGV